MIDEVQILKARPINILEWNHIVKTKFFLKIVQPIKYTLRPAASSHVENEALTCLNAKMIGEGLGLSDKTDRSNVKLSKIS